MVVRMMNVMFVVFSFDCVVVKVVVLLVVFNSYKCGLFDARNNMAVFASRVNVSVFCMIESVGYVFVIGVMM